MRWIVALLAAMVGTCLGLAYGWILRPVGAADTTPSSLRIDYRIDYVLMVAESFRSTQDVEYAKQQLAVLGGQPPGEITAAAARQARLVNYAPADLAALDDLERALQPPDVPGMPGDAPP
ncbi:MAG: hypothetical protein ACK2T0_02330 [Anaerolineales bacterium]